MVVDECSYERKSFNRNRLPCSYKIDIINIVCKYLRCVIINNVVLIVTVHVAFGICLFGRGVGLCKRFLILLIVKWLCWLKSLGLGTLY